MITLGALAERCGLEVWPAAAAERTVQWLASLAEAGPTALAPLLSRAQLPAARASRAGALLCGWTEPMLERPLLLAPDPRLALAALLAFFGPPLSLRAGIHGSAVVDARARIAEDAWIGPFCVIEAGVRVGPRCQLVSHVYLGAGAQLGSDCRLASHAVVEAGSRIGDGVQLGPGAVVGSAGFGYALDAAGLPHELRPLGDVTLGPGVRLGAHSCVDRATLGTTRVGADAKLDNLVQIGHNAQIGARSLLCAQVGVGGSAVLGAGVQAGGQAGIADHVAVGESAQLAAQAGVIGDVAARETVGGTPAVPKQRWLRGAALSGQLGEFARRLRAVEAAVRRPHEGEEAAETTPSER